MRCFVSPKYEATFGETQGARWAIAYRSCNSAPSVRLIRPSQSVPLGLVDAQRHAVLAGSATEQRAALTEPDGPIAGLLLSISPIERRLGRSEVLAHCRRDFSCASFLQTEVVKRRESIGRGAGEDRCKVLDCCGDPFTTAFPAVHE